MQTEKNTKILSRLFSLKSAVLLCLLLLTFSSDTFAGAMGNMGGNMGMGGMGMGGMGMGMGGPGVPINNGLIFLLIAGLLFGFKKMYDLSKQQEVS